MMDAFDVEHVFARRDLVQLLLDLKFSKANTASGKKIQYLLQMINTTKQT